MNYLRYFLFGTVFGAALVILSSCSPHKPTTVKVAPRQVVCITGLGAIGFMSDNPDAKESADRFELKSSDGSILTVPKSLCVEIRGGA